MIVFPNAKINLGLNVVSKRADGYHDLQTIFLPVKGLHDELEVTRSAEVDPYTFCQEGIAVDCAPENNLIIRAYERMRAAYTQVGNVHIRFCKQIPFGAGLGGGSADAAFMVRALNELFELKMTNEQKEEMVAPLGADCAFFVQNRPRMAEGIGTVFSEVPEGLSEQLQGKWLLLLKPECAVSTRDAYGGICPKPADVPLLEAVTQPISTWQQTVVNDFEATVFPRFPEIAALKQQLLQEGALYAAMSGSGATVFGLFDQQPTFATPGIFRHLEQLPAY